MALCHNSALVFKLDSRTITCNLISEFDSYPTIFSNWHFIDIFIYSFWLSGSEEMQCSAISPIPSNFSSWNRTIGLQILYATVIQRRRSAPVNRRPYAARAARARQESNLKNMVLETMRRPSAQAWMRFRLKAGTGVPERGSPLEDREPETLDGHRLQDSPIPFIVQIQFFAVATAFQ